MSWTDGIHYGYDEFSSDPYIPLAYSYSNWEGKDVLTTNHEYPRIAKTELNEQNPVITETQLVKPLKDRRKENFTANIAGVEISENNLLLIMIFILLLVMQINMYFTLNSISKRIGHKKINADN
jgi:hypothetical protein